MLAHAEVNVAARVAPAAARRCPATPSRRPPTRTRSRRSSFSQLNVDGSRSPEPPTSSGTRPRQLLQHRLGRLARRHSLGVGRRTPAGRPPSARAAAPRSDARSRPPGRGTRACTRRSAARQPPRRRPARARATPRKCAAASGGTKNGGSSGQPRFCFVRAVSSAPSGEPCASNVPLLFGRAVADHGVDDDQRRPLAPRRSRRAARARSRSTSLPSATLIDVPAVRRVPGRDVLGERDRRRPRQRDVVVVVKDDQPPEAQVTGQRRGLGPDALHHVAVAGEHEGVVAKMSWPGAVVARGQVRLADRHADRVGDALTERPGARLHAGRQVRLRVAGRAAAPLAKAAQLIERQVVAEQVQQRVQQRRAVARPTARSDRGPTSPDRAGRGAGSGSTARRPSARPRAAARDARSRACSTASTARNRTVLMHSLSSSSVVMHASLPPLLCP